MRPEITAASETSEALFARYRDTGDERAFSRLYDAFGPRLFAIGVRFFRRRHGDANARAMASDAAQETWLRIIRGRDRWSGSPGSFGPWVMTIHSHCLMGMTRAPPERDGPGEGASAADPERHVLARQALEHVSEDLSSEEMDLLAAYCLAGERVLLGAALGISQAALRKRIERAREKLRNHPRFGELFAEFTH